MASAVLPKPADAVDGGDDADVAGLDEVLAQHPQIGGAADEVRIVRVHVAELFSARSPRVMVWTIWRLSLPMRFLHGGLRAGLLALVVPRAQVEVLALAQFGNPRGALLLEILAPPSPALRRSKSARRH
jgi:hypothetical protein